MEVPKTMRACQVVEFNKPYAIRDVPVPQPQDLGPYEALIKVGAASFCHTDNMVRQGVFESPIPITASHEGAGTVVAVGSEISHLKPGDRILTGLTRNRCRKCKECLGPRIDVQYCGNNDWPIGIKGDGAFAAYTVVDGREAGKLPDCLSFADAAPLACAGVTMWRALYRTQLKAGQWVAIVGAGGGLGHLGVGFAKAQGLKVVGLDVRNSAIELAKECGADAVFSAVDKDITDKVHSLTNGGVDAAINLADSEAAVAVACAITRTHGTLVQVAQPTKVSIPFGDLMFRDIRVVGTNTSSIEQMQDMLETVAAKGIKIKTRLFKGIDMIPQLVEEAEAGNIVGKAVVVME